MADDIVQNISLTGQDEVVEALTDIGKAGQEAFKGLANAAGSVGEAFRTVSASSGDIGKNLKPQLDNIKQGADDAGKSIGDLGDKIGESFRSLSSVLGEPARLLGDLVEKASSAASSLGSAASGIADSFKVIGSAAAAVGAAIGAAEWGGTAVDHLKQLQQSLNMTAGGFQQVAAAAASISMPLDSFAGTVGKINDGIKQATISLGEQAEMMNVYEERIALFNSRNDKTDPAARREQEAQAAADRMQTRMHRMQQAILDSSNPFEAISANFAKFVEHADLGSATLERLQKQAEALQRLPPEIRFFKAFEELQQLAQTQPELASRLMNQLSEQSAKLGENLSTLVERGKAAKAQFDKLGPEGYAKAQELKVTGADEMASQLSKVTDAWTQMTSAAKSAGIAIAAALGPVAVGVLEGITAVMNGLKGIVQFAENALVALGKVIKEAAGAQTSKEKQQQAERTRIETQKDQQLAHDDPEKFRQSLGPTGVVGAVGFDLMNIFKQMFMGAPAQKLQTPDFLGDMAPDKDSLKLFKPAAENAADGLNKIPDAAKAAADALNKVGGKQTPVASTEAKAGGGAVGGWGGPKSDSVPIMASKGEFVVRADGSNLRDAIGFFGGFADGGEVTDEEKKKRRLRLAMEDPKHYNIITDTAREKNEAGFDPHSVTRANSWHGGPVGYADGGDVNLPDEKQTEAYLRASEQEPQNAQQIKYNEGLIKAYQKGQDILEEQAKLKKAIEDANEEFSHFIMAPTGGLNPAYDKAFYAAKNKVEAAEKALKKFMVDHIKEFGPQAPGGTDVTAQAAQAYSQYTSQFWSGGPVGYQDGGPVDMRPGSMNDLSQEDIGLMLDAILHGSGGLNRANEVWNAYMAQRLKERDTGSSPDDKRRARGAGTSSGSSVERVDVRPGSMTDISEADVALMLDAIQHGSGPMNLANKVWNDYMAQRDKERSGGTSGSSVERVDMRPGSMSDISETDAGLMLDAIAHGSGPLNLANKVFNDFMDQRKIEQALDGFANGGFVGGFADAVSGYANGGAVVPSSSSNTLGYHQLDIRTNAGTFSANVSEDTMQGIRNSALNGKLSQTGQRPSWYS